ncbi:MAG: hypothetical protein AAFP97_00770 [Pseudomonadota bacterium]
MVTPSLAQADLIGLSISCRFGGRRGLGDGPTVEASAIHTVDRSVGSVEAGDIGKHDGLDPMTMKT